MSEATEPSTDAVNLPGANGGTSRVQIPLPQPPQPDQAEKAPSTNMLALINTLADRADPIISLLGATVDRYQKGKEAEARFSIHMAWVAVLVVTLIIGVSAFLTYLGKVDGATFTFLLGLIVGYVLTFIRDAIKTPES